MNDIVKLFEDDNAIVTKIDDEQIIKTDPQYKEVGQLSSVMQYAVHDSAASLLASAFICEFPEGVVGELVPHNGGYLSTIRSLTSSDFVGTATFYPIETAAASYAMFNFLSLVTCQHYLSEINQQLSSIQQRIDKVLKFLYTDKSCEIYANSLAVSSICRNFNSIMKNETHRLASLMEVKQAKVVAEKNLQFYYCDMSSLVDSAKKSKLSDLDMLREDIVNYEEVLNLYGISTIMEILLSQNFDKSYLEFCKTNLEKRALSHNVTISKLAGKLEAAAKDKDPIFKKGQTEQVKKIANDLQQSVGEFSSIGKIEKVFERIETDYTTKSKFAVLRDGTVYKAS